MLLQMGVADAYGSGFEYAPAGVVARFNDLSRYIQHLKHADLKPGHYTDDTQMAIAVSEYLLDSDGTSSVDLAYYFVRAFKRDKRSGYAGRFYDLLDKNIKDAWDFVGLVEPHSRKSGGAMRAGPMGLIPNVYQCIDSAMWQASLTHATREGMTAAAASALMVHYFYYFRGDLGAKVNLPAYLEAHLPGFDWLNLHSGSVGSSGIQAVKAALTAIVQGSSLTDILQRCVAFTGDVDTVAAIALCAASFSDELDQSLPQVLLDKLETGTYGREFLINLDNKLLAKFPRPVLTVIVVEPDPVDEMLAAFEILEEGRQIINNEPDLFALLAEFEKKDGM